MFKYKEGLNKENFSKKLELKMYNGFGGFTSDYSEYWICESKENRLPVAWSNIMSNEKFGTVVTDGLGGYTWYNNSRTNRITKFSNDAYTDESSEMIYIELENKKWSLGLNEIPDEGEYFINYGFGYSRYIHESNELNQELTIYIPKEDTCKVSILRLKNTGLINKKIKIKYDIELQLGEKDDGYIHEIYNENLNMIMIKNNKNPWYTTFISSNEKINEQKEIEVSINSLEEKEIVIVLGCEKTETDCIDLSAKYTNNYKNELENTEKYWKEKVQRITTKTPMQSFDAMQNGWLVYQTIVSRMYGKTGFYQSSGGYGFRDQLQDAIGMRYVSANLLKNQILLHANHQFEEGDVEHWWHEDSSLGIRTRFSDDLLWLPYAVIKYIEFTGDYSILKENAYYLKSEPLNENEIDRVREYLIGSQGNIYEHCIRAINYSLKFGKNNLPLMKSGDWNDGMNKIGEKGLGESVWLGFFLYYIIDQFIPIIKHENDISTNQPISKDEAIIKSGNNENKKPEAGSISRTNENNIEIENNKIKENEIVNKLYMDTTKNQKINDVKKFSIEKMNSDEIIEELEKIKVELKNALNNKAWDGRWYKRAFKDDGKEVGSLNCDECKIDSIPQSWAVISNAGDNDKKYIALESAEKYLIDNQNNLVKLLTPPFEKNDVGYIASYAKGMRENGGQYTCVLLLR